MKPIIFLTSLLLLCCLENAIGQKVAARTGGAPAVPFQVGVGVVDVTPPVGYPIREGISTGIKDPIYAKALVFRQGGVQGALLICNLLSISRDLSRIVREQASKETGIPYEYISITATHSHTAPSFVQALQEYSDREAKGKLTQEDQKGYIAVLIKGMKDAIVIANNQVQAVAMKTGIGHATGISFNRRFLMKDGRIRTNPGRDNPDVVYPAGIIDPDVPFVMFRPAADTGFVASLSVFASHYSRGGLEFSSDYPYYLEERLKKMFGDQIVSVWGSGTCGDINTVDVMGKIEGRAVNPPNKMVEVVGNKLADAIKKAIPKGEQKNASLAVASKTVNIPIQSYTEAELQWAKNDTVNLLYDGHNQQDDRRRSRILALERIRRVEAIPPSISGDLWRLPVEIQVFRLDDQTAIVTLPGELFVEHGLELKKRSPFANTLVIELANIAISYVPTRRGFTEGAYEAINSRLAPGGGEMMVGTAVKMLNDIKIQYK